MQKKILYIIAGANGSGKSTLASELLPSENLDFLNCWAGMPNRQFEDWL